MHGGAVKSKIQHEARVDVTNFMAKETQASGTKAKAKNKIDSFGRVWWAEIRYIFGPANVIWN